ncbi:MAG TPA: PAS domain S-box protein [Acetobacteraceae bacterium]|nr:PAS domain S-box protein [Acetobacteraceae bacterium]
MQDAVERNGSHGEAAISSLERQSEIHDPNRPDNSRFRLSAIADASNDAIVGQPITRIVPPHGIAEEASTIDRIRRGEQIAHFETMRQCKDGRIIPVALAVSPIRDDQGRLIGASKIARDLSAMQRVHAELRHRETLLRSILDTVPDALVVIGTQGIIHSFSVAAARLFGYGSQEVVGRNVSLLLPPPDWEQHNSYWARYLSKGERNIVGVGRRKDGGSFPMELFIGEVNLPGARLFTAFVHDLTERYERERRQRAANAELQRLARHLAKARDAAEQSNRAKSRFLAMMSHELRTPLNGILGYAQLLRSEGGLTTVQDARVNAMLGAGKHLLEMITSVLDLSEIEAEHVELRAIEVDARAVAAACLDLVRPAAETKRLALSISMAPGTRRELVTDPMRLRQVLLNLLGNAVKFTSRGTVALRLRPATDGSALRIEVADTGPGIPGEQRQRLFQEFERLDNRATGTVEGAGLGLALSARLAKLIGGRLGHSDNPGGGSVFWLELPLDTGVAPTPVIAAASDVPAGPTAPAPLRALHVLVVDDVAMNRDVASSFLRAAGHKVDLVESGTKAVAAVTSTDFDVVLMDVRMPEMDGLEATRRIRALKGVRGSVPIVALTAQAFIEQVEECRKEGMDDHLAKPFDSDTLLAAVVRAAGAGHVRDDRFDSASPPSTAPVVRSASGSELLVLDPRAFERTASFLAPETVASYLQVITARGEAIMRGLRGPEALTRNRNELARAAHGLAGSVGMFGFERLAAVGLRFERAVQSGAPGVPALADALSAAVEVTLQEIHARMPRTQAA